MICYNETVITWKQKKKSLKHDLPFLTLTTPVLGFSLTSQSFLTLSTSYNNLKTVHG